ncbi:hypothetical protein [Nocardioides sp. 1609]|uniref:hypothetical protein n=1 Tax=Nocardioides sp. 1609 TaxID=2508327 RepID=UPI0010704267|nr:hypothetical protein [Nocardioides sp. 1609]
MRAAYSDAALDLVASVETYLTSGLFGDNSSVAGNAAAYYRGAARACALTVDLDPALVEEVDHPVLESLRRAYVDEALRDCMGGRDAAGGAALTSYLALRDRVLGESLIESGSGRAGVPGFLSRDEAPWLNDLLVRRFDETTTIDGARVGVTPVELTPELEGARSRSLNLARRSVPRLAADVFGGVRHVVLYRADQPYSGYTNAAPLFIFLGAATFEREHFAAELLLHESLHQKLNDISVVRSLFRPGYDDAKSVTVTVPWSFGRARTRHFAADRTFAAFHVYSHQALLYIGMAATAGTTEEADLALRNVVLSWARAAHFARAVRGDIQVEFGPDGRRLAGWLTRAVDDMGEFGLPDGTRLRDHREEFAGV